MRLNRSLRLAAAGVITAALAVATVPMAGAATVTDDNVEQALASAKAAADHQAMVDYFTAKAATARTNVALHEQMVKVVGLAGGPVRLRWWEHCNRLIAAYKSQEKAYEEMAAEEAKLTAAAK